MSARPAGPVDPTAAEVLTAGDVALQLGVKVVTVQRMARRHKIGVNWAGRAGWRFVPADVERFRRAQRGATAPAGKDPRGRGARAVS